MQRLIAAAAACLMAAVPIPSLAHHSFAMFDRTKSVSLHGSVRELQWTNPHCFIQVLVPDGEAVTEWNIEMHAPLDMYRAGWRPGTFKPGDAVTVVINPAKDGTHGGSLISAVGPDGKSLTMTRPQS